jgi:AcrR family transcriptional regulator
MADSSWRRDHDPSNYSDLQLGFGGRLSPRSRKALQPRRRPSQARSRATVEALLEAAARVFETRGYAGATTNRIAERAGVSIGSLYEYFPNKDALLVALMERHIAEGEAILNEAGAEALRPERPLRAGLEQLVGAMIALHVRERRLHRVLFEEVPVPTRVRCRLEEVEGRVRQRLADFLRDHEEVTAPDPELAAAILVQTVEALTHRLVVHDEGEAEERQREEMVTLAVAYLTALRRAPESA